MRAIDWKFRGHEFHLCLNAAALTDCYERFGDEKPLPELVRGNDRASFEAACWLLWKLSEQGELVRRWQGFDRGAMVPESYFRTQLSPRELAGAKRALLTAYDAAFRRETADEEDEEIDLVLLELQKKSENLALRLTQAGTQRLGLGLKETLMLTPGEITDLLTVEARRGNPRGGSDF